MKKKNVSEVLQSLVPLAVETIADYMEKKETSSNDDNYNLDAIDGVIDESAYKKTPVAKPLLNNDKMIMEEEVNDLADVVKLSCGMIKYLPVDKINEMMDERGLSGEEKVVEAFGNGFVEGFTLANNIHMCRINAAYGILTDKKSLMIDAANWIDMNNNK